ncbi:MAG: hypothetical protein WCF67_06280 [Chitinophagaceae bacterium]
MKTSTNYFLQTITHLRHYEEVMLYGNLLHFTQTQQEEASAYLAKEYKNESLNYPGSAPPFNEAAALWAAKSVYIATQLMLYRENKTVEVEKLLPAYTGEVTASAMLSADLVLRFLSDLIKHLKIIDPEDRLTDILVNHLKQWHYSGIAYPLPADELDFTVVSGNDCLRQLYIDRVIEYKNAALAANPALAEGVKAGMGIFTAVYWSGFKQATPENEPD